MSACWLNEDCIRGHHMDGDCRFPSWTSTCEHCGSQMLDPDFADPNTQRYADTPGGHADRHTLVIEAAERALRLLDQKVYVVTPSTGVVHSLPCIRATARNPLPWPEFRDKDDDRACSHCLPTGLPDLEVRNG